MTTKQTILAAADLIRKGWCQGRNRKIVDGRVCYCVFGALENVEASDESWKLVYNYISANHDRDTLAEFNDTKGRTQAEVIAMLEAVANQLEDES